MTNIIPFNFNSNEIRVVQDENNEPWFVAKDVAELLGYSNTSKAVSSHCKGVKTCPTEMGGQVRHVQIIPERDLYRLIMRSKLPSAEVFEEWVVSEVLPSIRKTGGFQAGLLPQTLSEALRLAADLEDQKLIAQAECDEAIKTKAQIGSKREASAMAKASVAVRKVNKLEDQLGVSEKWKQTTAISWLPELFVLSRTAYQQIGRKLSDLSKQLEIPPKEIEDTKYGIVKAYNVEVIEQFHKQLIDDPSLMSKYRIKDAA